ncbi:MAG: hypothetical protein IKH76_00570, partial [Clostridiales bacterium]|nr:hypothetical protein [Clostridiales bacterium]
MKRRKIIAFILSISIIAGSLPCTVFADTEPEAAQQEELARDEQEEEPKEESTEEHEEPEVEDPKAEKPEEKDEEPSEPTEEKTAPEADEDAAAEDSVAEDTHDEDTHDEDTADEEPDPTEDKQEADDKVVVGTVPRYAAGNEEAQKVTAETQYLNGGTWVVDSDVTVSKRLYVMGDVTLILNDGCTLTASKGIEVYADSHNLDKLTIDVPEGSEGTGSLVANAVNDDTAIGSNNSTSGYKAGLITINGGNITASGSGSGSGIGGRYNSNGVIINGGTVTATGGTSGYGIGAGTLYNGGIQINGGTVTATGGSSSSAIGGLHNVSYSVTISGGTVTANPGQSNSKGIGVHYDLDRCNILIGGDDLVKIDPTTFGGNIDFASQVTNGMKTFGPDDHVSSYQLEMIDGRLLLPYSDTETVKYVDEDGDEQTVVAKVLYGDITTLNGNNGYDGFYLSKFDKMSFANRVECIGNVKIILSDDIGLNASQGITVNQGNTLEIYGQSKGTGKLSAEGDIPQGYAAIGSDGVGNISQSGMIIINGGEIFASGGANNTGAGIGGGSNNDGFVTINGGNITAIAGNGAACIGGGYQGRGYVVIKGGVISAKDGSAYLPYGIGDGRDPLTKGTVSLNWTDVENDRYDAVYNGNVTLEKGFSDGSSGFAPGGITPARISGREIYPAIPVNVMTSPGVSVTSSQTYAKVGQSVRLDIDREPLRSLRDLTVKADGKTVPFDDQNDDHAFFTVPVASSSVEVTFVLTYYVGILQTANGVLETDKEYAAEGDTVTLTGDPDKNYVLDNASYYKPDHSEKVPVPLTAIGGSYYLSTHIYTTLVDGNVSTFWFVRNDPYVIFKADDPVVLAGYSFTTAVFEDGYPERNPKSWTIYGANFADDSKAVRDSDEWTAVTSVTNDTVIQPVNNATYDFASGDTSIPYQYYKLEITKPDGRVQMAEFTMRADKFVDVSGEGNTRTFTMPDGPINIYAGFRRNQFDISYSDHPNGQITGQADAVTGTSVSVTATPDDGYKVDGFSVVNADPESSVSVHLSALSGGFSNENETAAKLVDGDTDTKWYTDSDHYAVVKADKPVVMTGYILTTGGDTNQFPDRNWKSWTIYGANFGDDSKAVRDSDEWQVITAVTDDDTLKPVSKGEFEFRLDGIP